MGGGEYGEEKLWEGGGLFTSAGFWVRRPNETHMDGEMVTRELLHERILTRDRDRRAEKEKVCPSDQRRLLYIYCWSFI